MQAKGTYFAGFEWQIYGCLTYGNSMSLEGALESFTVFLERLTKRLAKAPVSCIAVLEHRYSGRGNYSIRRHWHFLMATIPARRHLLLDGAQSIWDHYYGNQKIEPYNPQRGGAHYLAKHAGESDFEYRA